MRADKILTGSSFLIATFMVVLAFVSVTSYLQLATAAVLYIVLVYIAHITLPKKARKVKKTVTTTTEVEIVQPKKEDWSIADIDKRAFLKLIGVTGISLFLYSIFVKKGETPFFRSATGVNGAVSIQDSQGKTINPAEKEVTDGYKITEVDDSVLTYLGFTNKDGAWLIMREDTVNGSFRYARGDSNFPKNWSTHENLNYDYFSSTF
ncbi:MAG TPA: hypothetical protein VFI61_03940 [Patescibacteria group bacterium]|nr:hypothetical protein [Patescibacteria group bacterium]